MIYLIATGHAATADDPQIAQLLVAAGYTVVTRAEYQKHLESLFGTDEPDEPSADYGKGKEE